MSELLAGGNTKEESLKIFTAWLDGKELQILDFDDRWIARLPEKKKILHQTLQAQNTA